MTSWNSVAASSADETPLASLDGSRVLLVEDEAIIAADIEFALEEAGAEVIGPALTLPQALELAKNTPEITGAILDVNLYGDSVVKLADHLSAREISIVFHTGCGLESRLSHRFPTAEFLAKPVLLDHLLRCLADRIS